MIDDSKYDKLFSGVDRLIDSLFMKKDIRLSTAECMKMICSSVCLHIRKDSLKNLYIVGTGSGKRLENFKGDFRNDIENNDVNESDCAITTGASPLMDSESLKTLSSADAVVLVEEIGASRYDDIARIKKACEDLGLRFWGQLFWDEDVDFD